MKSIKEISEDCKINPTKLNSYFSFMRVAKSANSELFKDFCDEAEMEKNSQIGGFILQSSRKFASIISLLFFAAIFMPQSIMAQHFSHGGGGGGGGRGGGGGVRMGGGGGVRMGGGEHAPSSISRSFNGGGRDLGNHAFRSGPAIRPGRAVGGGFHNEGVFHHGDGMHPYAYHPYHPYMWGPYWHPFGYFAAALTADAIFFNLAGQQYYYDNGVYYEPTNGGYTSVTPPIGAVVGYLPAGYLTIPMGDATYFYYAGVFYVSQGGSFRVVPAPEGAIVTEIPEGATDQNINGQDYLLYNNTYYQPISQNGQDAYEVVTVN